IVGLCLTSVDQGTSRGLEEAVVELADAFPEAQFCFIPMSQHPFVPAHTDLLLGVRLRAASPRNPVLHGPHHPSEVLATFSVLALRLAPGVACVGLLLMRRDAGAVVGTLRQADLALAVPASAGLVRVHLVGAATWCMVSLRIAEGPLRWRKAARTYYVAEGIG